MNELLKIEVNENGEPTVSGRMLHDFLEVKEKYTQWFNRMCEAGFKENVDFISFSEKTEKPQGGRPSIDHQLTLDMAKHLAMMQRNEKGMIARQYFIDVEKKWNSPEMVMSRALTIANKNLLMKDEQILKLTVENQMQAQQIAEFKPIKEYVDIILQSTDTVTITQIAADYGLSAKKLNQILKEEKVQHKVNDQWILYTNMMNKGYTKSETMDITSSDGRVEVKMYTRWTQKGRLKIHEILTNLGFISNYDKEQQKLFA